LTSNLGKPLKVLIKKTVAKKQFKEPLTDGLNILQIKFY